MDRIGFGRIHAVFTVLQRGRQRNERRGWWWGEWGRGQEPISSEEESVHFPCRTQRWTSTASALCCSQPPELGPMCLGKAGLDKVPYIVLFSLNLLMCFLDL